MAVLPLAGCVQRTITVTSTPPGALVHLNDQEVGRTPVTVPFLYYGTYDVRIVAEGRAPLWTTAEAKAPWWEFPGPDLLAEAVPGGRSDIAWHFDLEPEVPAGEVDPDVLRAHATQMRALTRGPSGTGDAE